MKNLTKVVARYSLILGLFAASTLYTEPSLAQKNITQVIEDEKLNLKFEFQGCQRKLKIVTCSFLLTKQEEITGLYRNRGFYMYANERGVSRAFTPEGEEYSAKLIQAGQKKGKYLVVKPLKGVPLRINLSFDLPASVRSFSAIAVNYKLQADVAPRKDIVFRDINISK